MNESDMNEYGVYVCLVSIKMFVMNESMYDEFVSISGVV